MESCYAQRQGAARRRLAERGEPQRAHCRVHGPGPQPGSRHFGGERLPQHRGEGRGSEQETARQGDRYVARSREEALPRAAKGGDRGRAWWGPPGALGTAGPGAPAGGGGPGPALGRPAAPSAAASSRCSWARPAPAAPTTARSTGRDTPAWVAARRAVSTSTTADAAAPPGRIAAPGPSARPSTVPSSRPMATVECEPPASAPSTTAVRRSGG